MDTAKQIFLPILAVMAFIVIVGFLNNPSRLSKLNLSLISSSQASPSPNKIRVKEMEISVDLADTQALREKGLSGRTSLGDDQGMLFVFPNKPTNASFWMKDMVIPIDIIWIKNGKIVKIDKNIPAPASGTPDEKLAIYNPDTPIDYVLEVNSGFSDRNGLTLQDSVDLSGLTLNGK